MSEHDLMLLAAGALTGAYLMLLFIILGGLRDDRRRARPAAVPARTEG